MKKLYQKIGYRIVYLSLFIVLLENFVLMVGYKSLSDENACIHRAAQKIPKMSEMQLRTLRQRRTCPAKQRNISSTISYQSGDQSTKSGYNFPR